MPTLIRLSALSFLTLLLIACSNETPSVEEQLRPVRFITLKENSQGKTHTFSGISAPAQLARLSFKVSGTLKNIPIRVGNKIKKGSLIAQLEPSQYQLQVQQSQATLIQTQANARSALNRYQRLKDLYVNNNASLDDLDAARASAETSQAQQKAAKKTLELAQLNESYTTLKAESDCTVLNVDVEVNENVSSGATVARVNCSEGIEVSVQIPDTFITKISRGIEVSVRFSAIPEEVFFGVVDEISQDSSESSATFPVTIRLKKQHQSLRAGLVAEIGFKLQNKTDSNNFYIPLEALINNRNGTFIYIAEESDIENQAIVKPMAVELGDLSERGIEILTELEIGTRIIVAGISVIRPEQRVLIN